MKNIRKMFGLRKEEGEVGIEIEMEGFNLPMGTDSWRAERDGSLKRDGALEYVLRRPCDRKDVGKVLNELEKAFENSALDPSDQCGVHIHINVQELNFMQVMNFTCMFLILEQPLVRFCGEDREGNLFCLRGSDAEVIIHGLRTCMENRDFSSMMDDRFRYSAINMTSMIRYGSVEFRCMKSSKDFQSVFVWARLLLKMLDASQKYEAPRDIVESMSMNGSGRFLQEIFGDMSDFLQCPGMDDMLLDGARLVQDIAYAKKRIRAGYGNNKPVIKRRGFVIEDEDHDFIEPPEEEPLEELPRELVPGRMDIGQINNAFGNPFGIVVEVEDQEEE